jgi:hypothetical protein
MHAAVVLYCCMKTSMCGFHLGMWCKPQKQVPLALQFELTGRPSALVMVRPPGPV